MQIINVNDKAYKFNKSLHSPRSRVDNRLPTIPVDGFRCQSTTERKLRCGTHEPLRGTEPSEWLFRDTCKALLYDDRLAMTPCWPDSQGPFDSAVRSA